MSDLGIVGQFGLILILSWCFFASRRENHAVRALVNMDPESRNSKGWFPTQYILEPKAQFLLAEHFAYAYRAVAQRFVFLFSTRSRPLLAITILLAIVPALVASWNAYTDMRDLAGFLSLRGSLLPVQMIVFQTIVQAALLVLVWIITYHLIHYDIETSLLLNGWQLAVEQVWMADWEATARPAARVVINVSAQTATALEPPKGQGGAGGAADTAT